MSPHFPEHQTKQPNILQFHPLSDLEWLLMVKNKCFTLFKVIWLPVRNALRPLFLKFKCFSDPQGKSSQGKHIKRVDASFINMEFLQHPKAKFHKIIQTHGGDIVFKVSTCNFAAKAALNKAYSGSPSMRTLIQTFTNS